MQSQLNSKKVIMYSAHLWRYRQACLAYFKCKPSQYFEGVLQSAGRAGSVQKMLCRHTVTSEIEISTNLGWANWTEGGLEVLYSVRSPVCNEALPITFVGRKAVHITLHINEFGKRVEILEFPTISISACMFTGSKTNRKKANIAGDVKFFHKNPKHMSKLRNQSWWIV
eukprot:1158746-Pelagomonas_calceolata.AAC.2